MLLFKLESTLTTVSIWLFTESTSILFNSESFFSSDAYYYLIISLLLKNFRFLNERLDSSFSFGT